MKIEETIFILNQKKHEDQLIQLMNQLNKDLFSCKEDRNTNSAKDTLNAINLLVKEQIKEFNELKTK